MARDFESKARKVAFAAARHALTNPISQPEAAKLFGSTTSSVQEATYVLRFGTEQEIDSIENGNVALGAFVRNVINKRTTKEQRHLQRKVHVRSAATVDEGVFEKEQWAKLRSALNALNGLPLPKDVVAIVKRNAMRRTTIDRALQTALGWLTEFSNAWKD